MFAGYSWYPPLLDADGSGADAYRPAFFDRADEEMAETAAATRYLLDDDPSRDVPRRATSAGAGADTPVDRGAAPRHRDHARRRPGQARRQHDDGVGARGADAVPRPRARRARRGLPARAQARRTAARACSRPRPAGVVPDVVIDRPKGYFPVPALSTLEGATLELVRETLDEARRPRARALFRPEHVTQLLAAPNEHLTTLEGSKLWQLALLELWLDRPWRSERRPRDVADEAYDEDRDADGQLRPGYARRSRPWIGSTSTTLSRAVARAPAPRTGCSFGGDAVRRRPGPAPDPGAGVGPRSSAGLAQRARALNRFLRDAYGERARSCAPASSRPASSTSAEGFEPDLAGRLPVPARGRRRSSASTSCATPTASSSCSRTTCARRRASPMRSRRAPR